MQNFRHLLRRAALAALLGSTTFGAGMFGAGAAQAQQQGAPVSFAIPAGPLDAALTTFGRQSGLQVTFDPALTRGLQTSGMSGTATPQEALVRLMGGSELGHSFISEDTVAITAPFVSTGIREGEVLLEPVLLYGDRTGATLDESRASVAVVAADPAAAPAPATVRDAFRQMANVTSGDWADDGFVIRGINSEGLVPGGAGAPLASFYVDGVLQTVDATRRGVRGFFDASQLEVYRGPQSTLSGRAALAGAMYLRTRDPEFARSGAAQLTYGSDNRRQAGLAFGDQLSPDLAYRLSAEWSRKESDINSPSYQIYDRYDDFIEDEYYTLRGKLLWHPGGDQSTRVLVSYSHSYDRPDSDTIAGPAWVAGAPGYDAKRGDRYGELTPEPYRSLAGGPVAAFEEVRETRVDNLGLEITHDISEALRLTAQTGFSRSVTGRDSINYGTPGEFLFTAGEFTRRSLSQELRLNYDDGTLKWVAGLYAGRSNDDAWRTTQLLSFDQSRNSVDITNIAGFGEASYEFSPGWRVIAGGRLDWIRQEQNAFYSVNGVTTADTQSKHSDTVFLPKIGFEYDLSPEHSLALIYQEGYRPGGSGIRSSDGLVYSYDAETAKNIELSWRGRFLEDRLTLAANLFHMNWDNQQIELLATPGDFASGYVANAGKSKSYGAEIELAWAATDALALYASAGLLKTEFRDFNITAAGTDYSGLPFPNAPERSIAAGFRWQDPDGWFAAASAKYVGTFMSRLEEGLARPLMLRPRTTVDAEIGYAWDSAMVTAYATNLFDKEYFVYEYGPGAMATLGDRREIGVRLDYRF